MENNVLKLYGTADEDPKESIENEEFQDELARYIRDEFARAETHKRSTGIEERLIRNLYSMKMEYSPEQAALVGTENNIFIGLCALKARACQSWLTDIVLNNIDKPWTIGSTPIPNLPDEAKNQVLDLLTQELSALTTVNDIRERAKELKTVALDQAKEIADKACKNMENTIADQLAEGNYMPMFISLIQDISVYPTAFVRGPFEVSSLVGEWNGEKYVAKHKVIPDTRIISPFDAYPSPTSSTTQNGTSFIERVKLLPSALYDSIKTPGFDEVNIRRALDAYEDGYKMGIATDAVREALEDQKQGGEDGGTIDTLIFNGLVPGKFLIEKGVLVKDPQKHYEAEVYLAGEYVVKAALNPNILGKRPIHSTSCVGVNRSIWGKSTVDLVYDTERVCNAAGRSIVKNMAFSSGPIVEADSARLEGQDPDELYPYKVFRVGPDLTGTNSPAIRFNVVESVVAELMAVFERFMKIADDLSGIPAYVLGNPSVAGAGRTMGGLSMLMGNAAKGIKNIQLNIDREILTPLITAFYVYNMQVSLDKSIKADAQVVARGATGLMQRELAQARLVEVLQMLVPLVPIWDTLPDGVKVILREVLKQTGLPVDDIIEDPKARENLMAKVRELSQGEAMDRGTSSPVPLPPQSIPPVNQSPTPLAMAGPA